MSTLNRPGVNLHYEASGQGPPVLLIQGVGVVGEGWQLQVNALKEWFQTLIFDNRGIGKSTPCTGLISIEAMAEDARALIDAAGWESAHVVGHSMGGVIAQQLALDCPQRVRSLSLLCTFARGKDAARLTPWVLWMSLRTRIGTRRMRRRAFLEMICPPAALQTADAVALAAHFAALIGRDLADQPSILMKQLMAMSRHDTRNRLGELRDIPTLVVSAEHDRIALPRYGQTLANTIPGARFELMREASHGVIIHAPEPVNGLLLSFLASVEATRPLSHTFRFENDATARPHSR
jgi:pimeloyl-ACP methyl ester carboxylesterase